MDCFHETSSKNGSLFAKADAVGALAYIRLTSVMAQENTSAACHQRLLVAHQRPIYHPDFGTHPETETGLGLVRNCPGATALQSNDRYIVLGFFDVLFDLAARISSPPMAPTTSAAEVRCPARPGFPATRQPNRRR
jgi:hypothetical protein